MRLIDADQLIRQLEMLAQSGEENASNFTTDSGYRAIEFNRVEDYIDAMPTIGDIPTDQDLKNPHLFCRKDLIDRGELIYRINENLPDNISEDAETIYSEIVNAPEVGNVYTMGGYKGDDVLGLLKNSGKKQHSSAALNKYWLLIPYIIQKQNTNPYAVPIEQIMYQKVCFLLELSGFPLGFSFDFHESYGVYSKEADAARVDLINAGIISERKYGETINMRINPEFQLNKAIFTQAEMDVVDRIGDLLCRMHSLEQAVEDSVVLLAYDNLHWQQDSVSEEEILKAILKEFPQYQDKKTNIIIAIQSLAMLGWIQTDAHRGVLPDAEEEMY